MCVFEHKPLIIRFFLIGLVKNIIIIIIGEFNKYMFVYDKTSLHSCTKKATRNNCLLAFHDLEIKK